MNDEQLKTEEDIRGTCSGTNSLVCDGLDWLGRDSDCVGATGTGLSSVGCYDCIVIP